mmetsp:Transcript_41180/g.68486  ORF Transcript_41180/g.68486 Transcript_41180/m.68486 type:complete len:388 (+) Transcript_41180:89-1252(+)|eukprot:CAMPEP_0119348624 /NCGR_PEP_ID=MMETSP1333-20130426/109141_1 /TAXON_ID=418940 /ORGANISM="Scyphosphaera apsteinii, Strain RCC1455" /LENGTH=387 /DNA_ID=CAMNT_0007361215 /DNA_START=81 /DNA_END=1244 /DNA_ORIENTATION=-
MEKEEEARLNQVCTRCKIAAKAAPHDESAQAEYEAAKSAFRAFQRAKLAEKVAATDADNAKHVSRAPDSAGATWTCLLCQLTISATDGRAKVQHELGKAHQKKLKQQAASLAVAVSQARAVSKLGGKLPTAPAPAEKKAGMPAPADKKAGMMFTCKLCDCTGPASAKTTHEAGRKHQRRLELIVSSCDGTDKFKPGDWVCCRRHSPQINFASKTECCRADCSCAREEGLQFDEVHVLVRRAKRSKAVADRAAAYRSRTIVAASDAQTLQCRECGQAFTFTVEDQRFYELKQFNVPRRCAKCRGAQGNTHALTNRTRITGAQRANNEKRVEDQKMKNVKDIKDVKNIKKTKGKRARDSSTAPEIEQVMTGIKRARPLAKTARREISKK